MDEKTHPFPPTIEQQVFRTQDVLQQRHVTKGKHHTSSFHSHTIHGTGIFSYMKTRKKNNQMKGKSAIRIPLGCRLVKSHACWSQELFRVRKS